MMDKKTRFLYYKCFSLILFHLLKEGVYHLVELSEVGLGKTLYVWKLLAHLSAIYTALDKTTQSHKKSISKSAALPTPPICHDVRESNHIRLLMLQPFPIVLYTHARRRDKTNYHFCH